MRNMLTSVIGARDHVEVHLSEHDLEPGDVVLLSSDGRRMLVDAIVGYAFARAEILRHAPHAILSGTLATDDR